MGEAISAFNKEELVSYITTHSPQADRQRLGELTKAHLYVMAKAIKSQEAGQAVLPKGWRSMKKSDMIQLASNRLCLDKSEFQEMTISEISYVLEEWSKEVHQTVESQPQLCPSCSIPFRVKKNNMTGEAFLGCPRFPMCRETRSYSYNGYPSSCMAEMMKKAPTSTAMKTTGHAKNMEGVEDKNRQSKRRTGKSSGSESGSNGFIKISTSSSRSDEEGQ